MSSPTFDHTISSFIPETFPMTIANNDPIHCSLIPYYHVKHPTWYFIDADLFFSQQGIHFGLHRRNFNDPYFSRWLQHIEPCKTAAIGQPTQSNIPLIMGKLPCLYPYKSGKADVGRSLENNHCYSSGRFHREPLE